MKTRTAWWSLTMVLLCGHAMGACRSDVLRDIPRRYVGERMWIDGVAMSIAELPSIRSIDAKARFIDFWQRDGREVRTQVGNNVEITSRFEDGCLYALQVPLGNGSFLPARLVLSDLKQPPPKVPHSFDWPPATEAVVLTDTFSEDENRVGRLLTYRIEKSAELASNQCLLRLTHAGWTIGVISKVYGSNFTWNARRGNASVDVTVMKDATSAIVTLNFTEVAG